MSCQAVVDGALCPNDATRIRIWFGYKLEVCVGHDDELSFDTIHDDQCPSHFNADAACNCPDGARSRRLAS